MKKVKLTMFALLATGMMFGQELKIDTLKDDMTDKVQYSISEGLLVSNEDQTLGFRIDPNLTEKNGIIECNNLIVSMAGLGRCNKSNKLIFLFEDGQKLQIASWNKFNCKSVAYFSLTAKHRSILSTVKVVKIRLTNGDSYKEYTGEVEFQSYFIELLGLIK